ncbi:hypothetical protein P280DRAFT_549978 [Massarina eburnea CBS 473.64]|uniref:Uncharacterized protein n=1 Tax=Massarina eburnea CBS 473.64 TaxID=1395130 RepID=A0A6A6RXV3_9PLEO|nr:hypothetical protein P280DRAFT_549978 [Massarina eburnea CBS 473.64]
MNPSPDLAVIANECEATTQRNRATRLLSLPGELRNRIYQYVLTEGVVEVKEEANNGKILFCLCRKGSKPGDVVSKPNKNTSIYGKHSRELNQMKYVCRQLHIETKGQGLKWNALEIFESEKFRYFHAHREALPHTTRFLDHCSHLRKAQITHITICEDSFVRGGNSMLILFFPPSLISFCRAYPTATVYVYLRMLNLSSFDYDNDHRVEYIYREWSRTVNDWHLIMRKKLLPGMEIVDVSETFKGWVEPCWGTDSQPVPRNFRVFPKGRFRPESVKDPNLRRKIARVYREGI